MLSGHTVLYGLRGNKETVKEQNPRYVAKEKGVRVAGLKPA